MLYDDKCKEEDECWLKDMFLNHVWRKKTFWEDVLKIYVSISKDLSESQTKEYSNFQNNIIVTSCN